MWGLPQRERSGNRAPEFKSQTDAILRHVAAQLDSCDAQGWQDCASVSGGKYFDAYLLGILDAVVESCAPEAHERLVTHEDAFTGFLRTRFACPRHVAKARFAALQIRESGAARPAGYIEGYADGMAALHDGAEPSRLLGHLAARSAAAALSQLAAGRPRMAQIIPFPARVKAQG
jgi:hypothetical protein